ncbi:MAG TPA: hypothetical protein VGC55_14650 [Dokdonella sp.]
MRLTAADRPGVAQPVPTRDIPLQPWRSILAVALALTIVAIGAWEWRMRTLGLEAGDLGDDASAWAEQRRRIDTENVPIAIVGDSRILFDTDLARFQALTGVRPVQLALAGTNARPFLEDLADSHFAGLAIVGIAELSYFRTQIGLNGEGLKRYRFESPAQRSSLLLFRSLSRKLAFLDDAFRLSKLMRKVVPDLRPEAKRPLAAIPKVLSIGDDRQGWLWTRIEHDSGRRDEVRAFWAGFAGPKIADDVIAMTQEKTRLAVEKIRARGGDVVFIRPPSAPQVQPKEYERLPRAKGWDALLAVARVQGIHANDEASMQGLNLPEYSHLTRACATVFTDAYVRKLAQITPRVQLRADAPAPLQPADCTAADKAVAALP